ncbi:hypothetical protein FF1_039799 [Malus domestica]
MLSDWFANEPKEYVMEEQQTLSYTSVRSSPAPPKVQQKKKEVATTSNKGPKPRRLGTAPAEQKKKEVATTSNKGPKPRRLGTAPADSKKRKPGHEIFNKRYYLD